MRTKRSLLGLSLAALMAGTLGAGCSSGPPEHLADLQDEAMAQWVYDGAVEVRRSENEAHTSLGKESRARIIIAYEATEPDAVETVKHAAIAAAAADGWDLKPTSTDGAAGTKKLPDGLAEISIGIDTTDDQVNIILIHTGPTPTAQRP